MAWPLIRLTNTTQSKLHRALQILDCLSLIIVLVFFYAAVHFSRTTGYYIKMISFLDGIIIPLLISVVALVALPVHVGGIVLYHKIHTDRITYRVIKWLFYFVIATLVIVIYIFCVIITIVVHKHFLEHGLHNGICASMKEYIEGGEGKRNMDLLQIIFQCCGSKSYKEWFYLRWDSLMPQQTTPGTVVSDDVPYSCCLQRAMCSCIHNNITTCSTVHQYDPSMHVNVSEVGCHHVLLARARSMADTTSLWLSVLLLWQLLLLILKRIQQTSLTGKTDDKYDTMEREAWLFGSAPGGNSREKDEDSQEKGEDSRALLHESE